MAFASRPTPERLPYSVDLIIADFPPNEDFRLVIGSYSEDDQFIVDFPGTTRAAGARVRPS